MSEGKGQTITLRPEQRQALVVKTASVALGSGAGCGKTTVLSERFLNELETSAGRPLRMLVALTFTDKAARELRQRIRNRCRAKLAVGENVGWWRSALRALEAAPIGTFHEFCARLLRALLLQAASRLAHRQMVNRLRAAWQVLSQRAVSQPASLRRTDRQRAVQLLAAWLPAELSLAVARRKDHPLAAELQVLPARA